MREPDVSGEPVRAGGGVVRRRGSLGPQIALVHRPRYDDWTLPKGKADDGESFEASALREVLEETGYRCELGPEVAEVRYRDHHERPKIVRYWLMYPAAGGFVPNDEVDAMRWVSPQEAAAMLTYAHDQGVIRRALAFDATLYLVRHAKAGDREAWTEDDRLRPLSKKGRVQAEGLLERFAGLEIDRVLTSPYDRCVQTVRPLAIARQLKLEEVEFLGEGVGFQDVLPELRGMSGAAVLCSHGDLIPAIVTHLVERGIEMRDPADWRKGSTWALDREAGLFTAARFLPPPD